MNESQDLAGGTHGGRTDRPSRRKPLPTWNDIDWRTATRNVRNLRQRLYRAAEAHDDRTVRSLQKLLLRSTSNALLSVRRVTQLNAGKGTPGVDRVVVKTPTARMNLVKDLLAVKAWKARPVRRVYIPKANGKRRPLGIPTIRDRCLQAVAKTALEPVGEAHFEATSYGFRPGRSCHDAIAKIQTLANSRGRKRWILDADIQGAFDHISQSFLLETDLVRGFPGKGWIKQWLEAGVMESGQWRATPTGAPQGGILSPLLLNVVLHGMEAALGIHRRNYGDVIGPRALVRYADDLVVFTESEPDAEKARHELNDWLGKRGLALSEEKTRIVSLEEGFDFLGFTVRQYPTAKKKAGKVCLITPSKATIKQYKRTLKDVFQDLQGNAVGALIARLNPIIRGQANYLRPTVASKAFQGLDAWLWQQCRHWVNRTHPTKSAAWKRKKYWGRSRKHPERNDQWVFQDKQTGAELEKFAWFPITRHVMVKGSHSPDNPALQDYWEQRRVKLSTIPTGWKTLMRRQHGQCPLCGESLLNGERIERDHRLPRAQGGATTLDNLQLLHYYCHQQKSAQEARLRNHRSRTLNSDG